MAKHCVTSRPRLDLLAARPRLSCNIAMARLADPLATDQDRNGDAEGSVATSDDEFHDLLDDEDLYDLELDNEDFLGLMYSFEVENQGQDIGQDLDDNSDAPGIALDDSQTSEPNDDRCIAEAPQPGIDAMGQTVAKLTEAIYPTLSATTSASPIKYHIPPPFLKRALSQHFPKRWWSHSFYRGPLDEKVRVVYCKTRAESEAAARMMLDEPILGFDQEWKSHYSPGIKSNVSLIQLASETTIALFHIALHEGSTPDELMAPSLRRILESPGITKTGVAVLSADGRRLKKYFRLSPRGLLELSHLHNLVTYTESNEPAKINKKMIGLAALTKNWLGGLEMHKGKVRTSDWSKPLDQEQIEYAAADAYAGYMLFRVMDEKRKTFTPVPPLPAFAEEYAPMPVAATEKSDASMPPPRRTTSHKKQDSVPDLLEAMDESTRALYDDLHRYHQDLINNRRQPDSAVPSYQLVQPAILIVVAQTCPADITTLQAIKGVGKIMIQKHSAAWLDIIATHQSSEPLEVSNTTTEQAAVQSPEKWRLPTGAAAFDTSPATQQPHTSSTDTDTMSASIASPRTPQPSRQSQTHVSKLLAKELWALRNRLASTLRLPVDSIASDTLLSSIAKLQPRRPVDLEACLDPGLPALLRACGKCGMGLLNFCAEVLPKESDSGAKTGQSGRSMGRWSASAKKTASSRSSSGVRLPLGEVLNVPASTSGESAATKSTKSFDIVNLISSDDFEDADTALETMTATTVGRSGRVQTATRSTSGTKRKF